MTFSVVKILPMEKDSDFYTDFKVNEEVIIVKIERPEKLGHDILEKTTGRPLNNDFIILDCKKIAIEKEIKQNNLNKDKFVQKLGKDIDCWTDINEDGRLIFEMKKGFPEGKLTVRYNENDYKLIKIDAETCYADISNLSGDGKFELRVESLDWPYAKIKKNIIEEKELYFRIKNNKIIEIEQFSQPVGRFPQLIEILIRVKLWDGNDEVYSLEYRGEEVNIEEILLNDKKTKNIVAWSFHSIRIVDDEFVIKYQLSRKVEKWRKWKILTESTHKILLSPKFMSEFKGNKTIDIGKNMPAELPKYVLLDPDGEIKIHNFPEKISYQDKTFIDKIDLSEGRKEIKHHITENLIQIERDSSSDKEIMFRANVDSLLKILIESNIISNSDELNILSTTKHKSSQPVECFINGKTVEKLDFVFQIDIGDLEPHGLRDKIYEYKLCTGDNVKIHMLFRINSIIQSYMTERIKQNFEVIRTDSFNEFYQEVENHLYIINKYISIKSEGRYKLTLEDNKGWSTNFEYKPIRINNSISTERILNLKISNYQWTEKDDSIIIITDEFFKPPIKLLHERWSDLSKKIKVIYSEDDLEKIGVEIYSPSQEIYVSPKPDHKSVKDEHIEEVQIDVKIPDSSHNIPKPSIKNLPRGRGKSKPKDIFRKNSRLRKKKNLVTSQPKTEVTQITNTTNKKNYVPKDRKEERKLKKRFRKLKSEALSANKNKSNTVAKEKQKKLDDFIAKYGDDF